jgi:hypothetical protein
VREVKLGGGGLKALTNFARTLCRYRKTILSTTLFTELCDALIIGDKWTGQFDRRGNEKSVCRVAVIEMVKLVAAGGGAPCNDSTCAEFWAPARTGPAYHAPATQSCAFLQGPSHMFA